VFDTSLELLPETKKLGQYVCHPPIYTETEGADLLPLFRSAGLVYSGGGIGGAILSIVVGKLLQRLSIAWTLRVFSLILIGASLPAALIIRSRLPRQPFRSGAKIFDL